MVFSLSTLIMSMTNVVAVNRDIRCCRWVQPTCGLTGGKQTHNISYGSFGNQLVVGQQVSQVALDDELITPRVVNLV